MNSRDDRYHKLSEPTDRTKLWAWRAKRAEYIRGLLDAGTTWKEIQLRLDVGPQTIVWAKKNRPRVVTL